MFVDMSVEHGDLVIVAARRADRLEALAGALGADVVLPVVLDVRDRAAIQHAVDTLPPRFSAVDVLVNNAGLALGLDPAPRADLGDWEQMIDTNCTGVVCLTRALLPGMVARGRGHCAGSRVGKGPRTAAPPRRVHQAPQTGCSRRLRLDRASCLRRVWCHAGHCGVRTTTFP
jgi:3-hydroxy acid dehydrogenase / malonic semialdehyde reductase